MQDPQNTDGSKQACRESELDPSDVVDYVFGDASPELERIIEAEAETNAELRAMIEVLGAFLCEDQAREIF